MASAERHSSLPRFYDRRPARPVQSSAVSAVRDGEPIRAAIESMNGATTGSNSPAGKSRSPTRRK
jgi:hypothetical protein